MKREQQTPRNRKVPGWIRNLLQGTAGLVIAAGTIALIASCSQSAAPETDASPTIAASYDSMSNKIIVSAQDSDGTIAKVTDNGTDIIAQNTSTAPNRYTAAIASPQPGEHDFQATDNQRATSAIVKINVP